MLKINIVIWWHSIKSWQLAISTSTQIWVKSPSKQQQMHSLLWTAVFKFLQKHLHLFIYITSSVKVSNKSNYSEIHGAGRNEDRGLVISQPKYNMKLHQTQETPSHTNKCHIWWAPHWCKVLNSQQMYKITENPNCP